MANGTLAEVDDDLVLNYADGDGAPEGTEAIMERLAQDSPDVIGRSGYPILTDSLAVKQGKADLSRMSQDFVIVTRTKQANRHGNFVQILPDDHGGGLQTTNYERNPVVLWDHGFSLSLPIGTSRDPQTGKLSLRMTKRKAEATVWFSQKLPEAAMIFALIGEDILRAASIQFAPLKARRIAPPPRTETQTDVIDLKGFGGYDFVESELFEWSVVAIGADADSIKKCLDRGSLNGIKIPQTLRQSLQGFAGPGKVWAPGMSLQAAGAPVAAPVAVPADQPYSVTMGVGEAQVTVRFAKLDELQEYLREQSVAPVYKVVQMTPGNLDEAVVQMAPAPELVPAPAPAAAPNSGGDIDTLAQSGQNLSTDGVPNAGLMDELSRTVAMALAPLVEGQK